MFNELDFANDDIIYSKKSIDTLIQNYYTYREQVYRTTTNTILICMLIDLENAIDKIYPTLTNTRKRVFSMYINGYSKTDIAKMLNVTKQRIDFIINSIEEKIKEVI